MRWAHHPYSYRHVLDNRGGAQGHRRPELADRVVSSSPTTTTVVNVDERYVRISTGRRYSLSVTMSRR